jgi:hypothetical protein
MGSERGGGEGGRKGEKGKGVTGKKKKKETEKETSGEPIDCITIEASGTTTRAENPKVIYKNTSAYLEATMPPTHITLMPLGLSMRVL